MEKRTIFGALVGATITATAVARDEPVLERDTFKFQPTPTIEIESGWLGDDRYQATRVRPSGSDITIEDIWIGGQRIGCNIVHLPNGQSTRSCR